MDTISITYAAIPLYLRGGQFYRNLNEDEPNESVYFEIPFNCLPQHGDTVQDLDDFSQLLRVMSYWMLDIIPQSILDYCNVHSVEFWLDGIINFSQTGQEQISQEIITAFEVHDGLSLANFIAINNRWELIVMAVSRIDHTLVANNVVTARVAAMGRLDVLTLLHEEGFSWHVDTCTKAAENNHLDCLKYAHQNGCPWTVSVYVAAATAGHLHIIEYAHEQQLQWHTVVCKLAAKYGHLACLQYARTNECPWDADTTLAASAGGHFSCLQYALRNDCPIHTQACDIACLHGDLHILKLLHTHRAPWNASTTMQAARHSNTACLIYLNNDGCPWDERTSYMAAFTGNVDCLRVAMERNCPYDAGTLFRAAIDGSHLECLQCLVDDFGIDMNSEPPLFHVALLKGNIACLEYLIDQGMPFMDKTFPADEDFWLYCDQFFKPNHAEFIQCINFVVLHGWPIEQNLGFVEYLVDRDLNNCEELLLELELIVPM